MTDDWRDDAACKGKSQLFFAGFSERPEARLVRESQAAALCADCPVAVECRGWARGNVEIGFWGGESTLVRALDGVVPGVRGWPGDRDPRVVFDGVGGRPEGFRGPEREWEFGEGPEFSWGGSGSGRVTPLSWREQRSACAPVVDDLLVVDQEPEG